jgi:hypothetical protein
MGHQIEWLDNSIVYLETSTPTETGIRVVLKDGRVFEIDLVEPIVSNERWKSHKLVGIYKAVSHKQWGLIPHPESKWGKQVLEHLNGDSEETPDFDGNDWFFMTLAGGELNKQHGIDFQSICGFARFEVNPEFIRTVGMRAFHESQLQQDELSQTIIDAVENEGAKTRKRVGEAEHAIKEDNTGPNKLADVTLSRLKAMAPDYDEQKGKGGGARGKQRRLRTSADPIFRIIIKSTPKRILNRKSVLAHISTASIVQEIAEAIAENSQRTPKMNRWIKDAPKKKRASLKRTLQFWIKECRDGVGSTTEDIESKHVR